MAIPVGGEYGLICDPGPCDPYALVHQFREFGVPILTLIAVAAFVAGWKLSRSSLLLPALCMATIAAGFYLHFAHELKWQRHSMWLNDRQLSTQDGQYLARAETLLATFNGRTFLNFGLIPFVVGVGGRSLYQRRRRTHAA